MDDLIAFLRARIDEDEQVATEWPEVMGPPPEGSAFWFDYNGHPIYEPRQRRLREVEAKRRIIEGCQESLEHEEQRDHVLDGGDNDSAVQAQFTLRLLALPYSDHEDYRDEWKP